MSIELKKEIEQLLGAKPFLSANEIAGIFDVSPEQFIEWNTKSPKNRRVPQIKIGSEQRYPRPAVVAWVVSKLTKLED